MKNIFRQKSTTSHEEYVNLLRKQIVQVATKILNEELGLIEGTRLLSAASREVTNNQFDPDFLLFVAVDSETDALPIGKERQYWADYALVEKDKEIKRAEEFYREQIIAGCKVLIERFTLDTNS